MIDIIVDASHIVMGVAFVGEGGDIEIKQVTLDTDASEAHLARLRKDIYDAACGVDAHDAAQGNTSGVAIRLRYSDRIDEELIGVDGRDMDLAGEVSPYGAISAAPQYAPAPSAGRSNAAPAAPTAQADAKTEA